MSVSFNIAWEEVNFDNFVYGCNAEKVHVSAHSFDEFDLMIGCIARLDRYNHQRI